MRSLYLLADGRGFDPVSFAVNDHPDIQAWAAHGIDHSDKPGYGRPVHPPNTGDRTHARMNGYRKLRRCTEKNGAIVYFYLYLAAAFVTVRCLIQRARITWRWERRPTTRRLK